MLNISKKNNFTYKNFNGSKSNLINQISTDHIANTTNHYSKRQYCTSSSNTEFKNLQRKFVIILHQNSSIKYLNSLTSTKFNNSKC